MGAVRVIGTVRSWPKPEVVVKVIWNLLDRQIRLTRPIELPIETSHAR